MPGRLPVLPPGRRVIYAVCPGLAGGSPIALFAEIRTDRAKWCISGQRPETHSSHHEIPIMITVTRSAFCERQIWCCVRDTARPDAHSTSEGKGPLSDNAYYDTYGSNRTYRARCPLSIRWFGAICELSTRGRGVASVDEEDHYPFPSWTIYPSWIYRAIQVPRKSTAAAKQPPKTTPVTTARHKSCVTRRPVTQLSCLITSAAARPR